jgi:hypothetical protein
VLLRHGESLQSARGIEQQQCDNVGPDLLNRS